MTRVLLLDQAYLPVGIIHWHRAISLWFTGKIEILEAYEDEVRSPTIAVKMPAVVRLVKRALYRNQKIRFSKRNLYLRDEGKCQYCMKHLEYSKFTVDHIIPKSRTGKSVWENLVICCQSCNLKKADRTPKEASMYLQRKPVQPSNMPYVLFKLRGSKTWPIEWDEYLAFIQHKNAS